MRTVVEESLKSFLGEIEKEKETEERAKELAEKLIDALRKAGGEVKMRETEGAYVIEARMPDGTAARWFMRRFQGVTFEVGDERGGVRLELDATELPNEKRVFVKGKSKIHYVTGEIVDVDEERLPDGRVFSNNEFDMITEVKRMEILISREFRSIMISM